MLHTWRLKVWKMELELLNLWADTVVSVVELYICEAIYRSPPMLFFPSFFWPQRARGEEREVPTYVFLPQIFTNFLFAGFIAMYATLASRDVVHPSPSSQYIIYLLILSIVRKIWLLLKCWCFCPFTSIFFPCCLSLSLVKNQPMILIRWRGHLRFCLIRRKILQSVILHKKLAIKLLPERNLGCENTA